MSICRVSNTNSNTGDKETQDFERNRNGFYLQSFERQITRLKTRSDAEGKQIACYVFNFEVTQMVAYPIFWTMMNGVQGFFVLIYGW